MSSKKINIIYFIVGFFKNIVYSFEWVAPPVFILFNLSSLIAYFNLPFSIRATEDSDK